MTGQPEAIQFTDDMDAISKLSEFIEHDITFNYADINNPVFSFEADKQKIEVKINQFVAKQDGKYKVYRPEEILSKAGFRQAKPVTKCIKQQQNKTK